MTITNGIIQIYRSHNRDLIPINLSDKKRPLDLKWQARPYEPREIHDYAARGYNLGFRMGPTDLIIDVDPRNGGNDGLAALLADFQKHNPEIDELEDIYPTVRTGGGGWHFYAQVPYGFKSRNTLPAKYGDGVEFKGLGRQVIIPGSTHPSGNKYYFDDLSPFDAPAQPLPEWLMMQLTREPSTVSPSALQTDNSELTNDELHELLKNLPAGDYANNEDWFNVMAAAHEATQGAGLETFINWSMSDPSYVGHDAIIRTRWLSFQPGKGGNIGVGTLYKEVVKYGGELPAVSTDSIDMGALGDLPPAPVATDDPDVKTFASNEFISTKINGLTMQSTAGDIKEVLGLVARKDILDQELHLSALRDKTGRSLKSLKQALGKARIAHMSEASVDIDDVALEITTYLLQQKFNDGAHLIHGKDQRFWEYKKTHWVAQENNIIENYILKAAYQYRQKHPQQITPVASLITQGEKVLRARRAIETNLNECMYGRPSVVNTKNCEVWIDSKTGNITTREHSPDSWLTTCLDVDFDPKATCPRFSLALQQMFVKHPDFDDVIRHLWEMIGYIIQPQKNIATWAMFHGEGANGKTVVLNVLKKLLGKAALTKSIEELDTKRNNHAFADLPNKLAVIDEDLDCKMMLPDSIMKKVSENKFLNANPKNRASYEFLNTAIVLFATNEMPRVKDLSKGMRRRAHVFNFNRIFEEHEQDTYLGEYVMENEMGGVLAEALRGFKRLRKRGGWQVPKSCVDARESWLVKANTITEFVSEMLHPATGGQVAFSVLFSTFRMWCMEQGYNKPHTKPTFKKSLIALGLDISNGTGNQLFLKNFTVKSTEFDMGIK